MQLDLSAMRHGPIMLHRITEANFAEVFAMFEGFADSEYMQDELTESYQPTYDSEGRQTNYGFYVTLDGALAGLVLLGIDEWPDGPGSTGADMLIHMRGKGVTPATKPLLFYLGFALLGLNRIATGCFVSNRSSRRSIEKTPGFLYEGRMRESARNDDGEFEDEYIYGILRSDWLRLYDPSEIEVVGATRR
jgi:ribosomal-protein-serine acetyltransferase